MPDPDSCSLSPSALRALGQGILRSLEVDRHIYAESPPEALLGALLRFAARCYEPPAPSPIDVLARECVRVPPDMAKPVEVDLVVRSVAAGTAAVIEVDGWRWHRHTAEEHAREIEQDRRIRRCYPLVRYSAREMRKTPWSVLLDVYEQMRDWPGFAEVEMPAGVRAVAEACAAGGICIDAFLPDDGAGEPAAVPPSCAAPLRDVAASLPLPPPTADPALQRVRQEHPRHHALWTDAEVAVLREAFARAVDVEEIARAIGRTVAAVWAQLGRMGLADV